jgi:hypothetical protein
MKIVAIGTAVSWVLLGTGVGSSLSVVQYGALGLLSFIIVWFCMKGFPAILKILEAREKKYESVINELKEEIKILRARNHEE